jgi:hypothetical protein
MLVSSAWQRRSRYLVFTAYEAANHRGWRSQVTAYSERDHETGRLAASFLTMCREVGVSVAFHRSEPFFFDPFVEVRQLIEESRRGVTARRQPMITTQWLA